MKKRSSVPLQILIALWFAGCVQTQATLVGPTRYQPVDESEVVIYLKEEEVPGPYERVAIIHMQGSSTYTNEAQMIAAAKRKAAKLGANGVILNYVREASDGAKVAGKIFGIDTQRRGQSLAIYVLPAIHDYRTSLPGGVAEGITASDEFDIQSQNDSSAADVRYGSGDALFKLEKKQDRKKSATRLPNFRGAVAEAKNFSDDQILAKFKQKYPRLRSLSDDETVELIERRYAKLGNP